MNFEWQYDKPSSCIFNSVQKKYNSWCFQFQSYLLLKGKTKWTTCLVCILTPHQVQAYRLVSSYTHRFRPVSSNFYVFCTVFCIRRILSVVMVIVLDFFTSLWQRTILTADSPTVALLFVLVFGALWLKKFSVSYYMFVFFLLLTTCGLFSKSSGSML